MYVITSGASTGNFYKTEMKGFIIHTLFDDYELRNSTVEPYGKQNEIFLFLENMSKKKGNDTLKV